MIDQTSRTQYVEVTGGRIAYEVTGSGPLVVLCPGLADTRRSYRFLAPLIAKAGYRVASVDLRGHGESSTGWESYSRTDTAGDLIHVVEQLGGPAVIVGQSFSGGSATIAAATNPELVSAIVEIDPLTRPPTFSAAALVRNSLYRRGATLLGLLYFNGRVGTWMRYLDVAYPGRKPADWDTYRSALEANLNEPGRMDAAMKMIKSSASDAAAQLPNVKCPVLVIMGSKDPDFPDPEAEAVGIVGALPTGLGRYAIVAGAGHYPHAQYPQQVADVVLPFLKETRHA